MRRFITSYAFVVVVFVSGFTFGLGYAPGGYVHAVMARDAVKLAYNMGQESIILKAICKGRECDEIH